MDRYDTKSHVRFSVSIKRKLHFTKSEYFTYRDMPLMKPALNWGIQYKTLLSRAPGNKDRLMREHLEIVYPGVVYNGWGERVDRPMHAVVPELMGNIK